MIEVLLALAVFLAISVSLYSAFRTGILVSGRMDSSFTVYEQARAFLNRIELDLNNAFSYSPDDSEFEGSSKAISFFSLPDKKEGDISYPDFCRITYKSEEDSLRRAVYEGMEPSDLSADSQTLYAGSLFETDAVSFSYASPSQDALGKSCLWHISWPAKDDPFGDRSLPLAVKINLKLKDAEFNKVALVAGGRR